jgi:inosine/xanthosine triphosphate pyrophosphatase family protein
MVTGRCRRADEGELRRLENDLKNESRKVSHFFVVISDCETEEKDVKYEGRFRGTIHRTGEGARNEFKAGL